MMRSSAVCFLLLCSALQTVAVSLSPPDNGIARPRRERRVGISASWNADDDRQTGVTRRPGTGMTGWQYIPGNKWKAPRDAEAEKRRIDDRIRRRRETPRLRVE